VERPDFCVDCLESAFAQPNYMNSLDGLAHGFHRYVVFVDAQLGADAHCAGAREVSEMRGHLENLDRCDNP